MPLPEVDQSGHGEDGMKDEEPDDNPSLQAGIFELHGDGIEIMVNDV